MPTPLQLDINYVVYNISEIIETKQNIPILKNLKVAKIILAMPFFF